MAGETMNLKTGVAASPAHPNVDSLFRFIHDEGDEQLIRTFILLLENVPSAP